MNTEPISKNRNTPGYEIAADADNNISVLFYPVDLSQKEGCSIVPCCGLRGMFERRKQMFLADMALMAELSASDGLCNSVQQYSIISDESRLVARSSLYRGERISECMTLKCILLAVSAVCRAVSRIFEICRTADISPGDIICEKNSPDMIHILYVSSVFRGNRLGRSMAGVIMGNLMKSHAAADNMVVFDALINRCTLHPLVKRSLAELIAGLIVPDCCVPWEKCAEIASMLASMPEEPFFLCVPQSDSVCTEYDLSAIDNAFHKSDVVALYPACDTARNCAIGYCQHGFVHAAYADCSDGIRYGIESESFALSSGESGYEDRLARVESMCISENTLLILDNFNEEDEEFSRITRIPAKIILISGEDLADYGLTSIRVTEE